MKLFAIGDLHLSFAAPRPMDRFGEHWRDHVDRLRDGWLSVVGPADVVLVAGDISWALNRSQAEPDLRWLAALPGRKILVKGNHDPWWPSGKALVFDGLESPPVCIGELGIAGTRGWEEAGPGSTEEEQHKARRVVAREQRRLTSSLEKIAAARHRVAVLHYPPEPFITQLLAGGAEVVVYGHLHLNGLQEPVEGDVSGMAWRCVAADRLGFVPARIL
jgi:predicted phosphohydrolase